MNGKDLLEAMSFVDEAYIQEAEEPARRRILWKPIAAMAACFGLVLASWQLLRPIRMSPLNELAAAAGSTYSAMKEEAMSEDMALTADAEINEARNAPMMTALLCQMTVEVTDHQHGILTCTVTDPGTTDYTVGTELHIAIPESAMQDTASRTSIKGLYLLTLDPEETDVDILHPLDMVSATPEE